MPLRVALRPLDAGTGNPLTGAVVEVWQADHEGRYSAATRAFGPSMRDQVRSSRRRRSRATLWPGRDVPARQPAHRRPWDVRVRHDLSGLLAHVVVSVELVAIAVVRKRLMHVSLTRSLIQVHLGRRDRRALGIAVGHA